MDTGIQQNADATGASDKTKCIFLKAVPVFFVVNIDVIYCGSFIV